MNLLDSLISCALGTAPSEIINDLARDDIVSKSDGKVTLTQDGNDLKNELRLAGSGYLSNQSKTPTVGNELDELLSRLG